MDLNEAIAGRRSVRDYTRDPVDERTINQLIAAAIQAPSAMNEQPWTFTVVRDQALLDRISQETKQQLLATVDAGPQVEHLRSVLGVPGYQIFYHAPVLVLISAAAAGPWASEDCALAAGNLMLAAHAAGLGSCWIGFAHDYLHSPAGRELLGLPAEWVPVAPIILGHPKSVPQPVPRKQAQVRWVG